MLKVGKEVRDFGYHVPQIAALRVELSGCDDRPGESRSLSDFIAVELENSLQHGAQTLISSCQCLVEKRLRVAAVVVTDLAIGIRIGRSDGSIVFVAALKLLELIIVDNDRDGDIHRTVFGDVHFGWDDG
jgi:hypothetical protein